MLKKDYDKTFLRIGERILHHVYEKYTLRPEKIDGGGWKSIIYDIQDKYSSLNIEVIMGGLIATLKDLESQASYPDADEEPESMIKIIKKAFYTRYYSINRAFNEWKGLQHIFFTYANELSFKILGDALFGGFLSHSLTLFDELEIIQWLATEGCTESKKEKTLTHLYESLPWTSKQNLLSLLRERRKRCLEKESIDPIYSLTRRWNMERVLEYTDGLYYYDVVRKVIEKDPSVLKKSSIVDSVLSWSTDQFIQIEKGIGLDQLPSLPEEKEPVL